CSWVIISAEDLSFLSRLEIESIKSWLERLGAIHVVYFARQLESWMASNSQQRARRGFSDVPARYEEAIKRLFDFPLAWREVFIEEGFFLIRFEEAVDKGLTNSLLSVAGLPDLESMGIKEKSGNKSVSAESVECFYQLNRIAPHMSGR